MSLYLDENRIADITPSFNFDAADLGLVAAAFGSIPGAPNWSPAADLNGDGKGDIFDLVRVGRNFGKSKSSEGK